jgi:hypothetical protein
MRLNLLPRSGPGLVLAVLGILLLTPTTPTRAGGDAVSPSAPQPRAERPRAVPSIPEQNDTSKPGTHPGLLQEEGSPRPAQGSRSAPGPIRLEFPDDAPGIPAQPVPGAPPSPPRVRGGSSSVQVNVDAAGANIPGDAANEPSITVDPNNPQLIAIGWRQFDTVTSNFRQAGVAYSQDGGRTWTFPGVLTPGIFRSDPVLAADAGGAFYYNSLKGDFTCDVFRSTDGGATWGPPVPAYGGDKQWMTIDRTEGTGAGFLHCSWSGFGTDDIYTRSTDGGQTFSSPSLIPQAPRWGTLDVAPNGDLYVSGVDGDDLSIFYVSRSTNAQDASASPPTFTTVAVDLGGSLQYGTGPNPGGLLGQVWLAVDPSDGPTAGYLYLLASVDPPGPDPLDVHFARSTDGGQTWSDPIQVNDDVGDDAWQWFATMSVAPNGRIDVVWNDTRNTGEENLSELTYAGSTDGGETWSENQVLSPVWDSFLGWPDQNKIGDYYHMVSDLVGADLAWAATFNGEEDVYFLRIGQYDCNGNGVGDLFDIAFGTSPDINGNGIPDECEDLTGVPEVASFTGSLESTPNPFGRETTIRFRMPVGGAPATLRVFDVLGRRIRTLWDAETGAGLQAVTWDGTDDRGRRVAPGLYLYELRTPQGTRGGTATVIR